MASPLSLTQPAPDSRVATIDKSEVFQILESNRMACEYQPIIEVDSGDIWAYEALARFQLHGHAVAPDRVFDSLYTDRTLFFMLESRTKRFQIQHRPSHARLFLNVDPHVCEEDYQLEHWVDTFGTHDDVVVEIIENTNLSNLDSVRRFSERLAAVGVEVALDDVGGRRNLFSFELLDHCQVVKLDRRWLSRLDRDRAYGQIVRGLLDFAAERGIRSVLEGVETPEHLAMAERLGVDFVQGFYFRDAFITVKDTAKILVD